MSKQKKMHVDLSQVGIDSSLLTMGWLVHGLVDDLATLGYTSKEDSKRLATVLSSPNSSIVIDLLVCGTCDCSAFIGVPGKVLASYHSYITSDMGDLHDKIVNFVKANY